MDNGLQASQSERVAHSAKLAQTSVPAPSTAANDIKKDLLDLDCSSPTPTSSYPGMGRYPPPEADSLLLNSGCCSYLSTWTGDSLQQQHQQHQHQQTMLSSAFQDYGLQQSPHHQHHHLQQQQHQQQLQHQQQQQYNLQPAMYDLSVSSRHHHLAQHQHLQPHLAPPPLPPMMPHHQQSAQHPSEQQQQQQQQQQQLKPPFGYLPLCHQPLGDGLSSVSTPVYHSAATGGIVTKGAPPPVQLPPPPLPPPPQPSLPAPPASAVTAARGANHSVSSSKSSSCSPPAVGSGRGHRPDKRPVPDTQKDTKYFERRKRNNEAAKKSRDARKHREDEVAVRASFLEKENAVLKAQMASLREEANSLRELLRKHSGLR